MLLVLLGCARPTPIPPTPEPELAPLDALEAWARLYGQVRWFHPADEAAGADWDAIAVEGVAVARAARTPEELRDGLTALLASVAPEVQLWTGAPPPPPPVAEGPFLAWQHLGWSFGGDQAVYRSLRAGRPPQRVGTAGAVTATNGVNDPTLRGRTVRASARVRVEAGAPSGGFLWLRVDHGERSEPASRVGWDAPALREPAWRRYEVTTEVAPDATWVVFGVRLAGEGTLWADDFRLEVREPDGRWSAVPIRDAGLDDEVPWWVFDGLGYDAEVVEDQGDRVLRLTHANLRPELLFPELPAAGEVAEGPIGAGLGARVPLTAPTDDRPAGASRPPLEPERDDPDVRVAAALVAWNVLRHFHPYEAELHVDWDGVLRRTLEGAVAAEDRAALVDVLWGLLADVPDGHGWAAHPAVTGRVCSPAFRWLRVGDDLVVTSSAEPELEPGDLVRAVDGVPTAAALAHAHLHVSGSEAFRSAFAAERLATAPCGSASVLEVERDGARREVRILHQNGAPPLFDHPGIEELPDGLVLVDLNTVGWEELRADLDTLRRARGLVLDLREYPAPGLTHLLEHLLDGPDEATAWMRIPRIVRPGEVAGWEPHEWALRPAEPHLDAPVALLTSPLAISAAESLAMLMQDQGLATLVGGRTAGTNGNATGALLPGGYRLQFTGMRVVHPDGSPFHLAGVAPDVAVEPTLEGLRAGRDEVRDAAVAWLRAR